MVGGVSGGCRRYSRIRQEIVLSGDMLTLPDTDQAAALRELEDFLKTRLEAARRGKWSEQTVDEIVAETLQEKQHS